MCFQTGDTSQFDRTFTVVRFSLAAFSLMSAVEMIIIVGLVWKLQSLCGEVSPQVTSKELIKPHKETARVFLKICG